MRQKYTNVQGLIETIRERKSQGETNREIATSLDLTLKQVQQLITRENRRERLLAQGCVLRACCRKQFLRHALFANKSREKRQHSVKSGNIASKSKHPKPKEV